MIRIQGIKHEFIKFPVGEPHVKLDLRVGQIPEAVVTFKFERSEEIVELLLICDALKRADKLLYRLEMDYVPFGRQDRVAVEGEAFSLKVFCDLINGLGFEKVSILDPHSDVTTALINNVEVMPQEDIFLKTYEEV